MLNLIKKAVITLKRVAVAGQAKYLGFPTGYDSICPYGFYSKAPIGSMVLLWNATADQSNKVGLEYDNKKLMSIENGEVILYHPEKQSYVIMKNDGSIEIKGSGGDVNINSNTNIDGNVSISGNLTVTGNVSAANVTASSALSGVSASIGGKDFSTHAHSNGTYTAGATPVTGNSGSVV